MLDEGGYKVNSYKKEIEEIVKLCEKAIPEYGEKASFFNAGASEEEIAELYKCGSRKPKKNDPEYSLYDADMFDFPVGLPIAGGLGHMVKARFTQGEKVMDSLKEILQFQQSVETAPLKVPKENFLHFIIRINLIRNSMTTFLHLKERFI